MRQTIRVLLFLLAVLVIAPLTARAQLTGEHALRAGQPIPLAWDAPQVTSGLAEDQVAGYEVAIFDVVQTGAGTKVAVKSWAVGPVTTTIIPANEVPAAPRPFFVSVRARSVAGVLSAHSNSLGFRDPSAPAAPGNLRRPTAP